MEYDRIAMETVLVEAGRDFEALKLMAVIILKLD